MLGDAIKELDYLVEWRTIQNGAGQSEEIPYPRLGLDENFDKANAVAEESKEKI